LKYRLTILASLSSIFLLLLPVFAIAQSRQDLEQERMKIIERIEQADEILNQVQSNKKASLRDFRLLERKIKDRERLISTIQNELILSEASLEQQKSQTTILQKDVSILKKRYYELLNAAYKQHHSYNKWAFIFNSKSINDSFQKWKYIKQYEAYCRAEYEQLVKADQVLNSSISTLNNAIAGRQQLLDQESAQFDLVKAELEQKDALIEFLKSEESTIKLELEKQKQEREVLNSKIENFILSALRGESNNTVNTTSSNPSSNAESISFENRKGTINWPVNGYITSTFGRQKHPTLRDVYINNNGVDIVAKGTIDAISVHSGIVVGLSEIPGFGLTVIIKHEQYYTVYSKLKNCAIVEDQYVDQGTRIGEINVDESGQRVLHFEVWKGKQKMNPSQWLIK